MTPTTRSTLKLDLKDLSLKPSTPHIGRIGLVVVSAVAIVSTIVSIDNPSAATANLDQVDRVHTSDLFLDPEQIERSFILESTPAQTKKLERDHNSPQSISQTNKPSRSQHHRKEIKLAMMAPTPQRRYSTPSISTRKADHLPIEPLLESENVKSSIGGFNTQLAAVNPDLTDANKNSVIPISDQDNDTLYSILGSLFDLGDRDQELEDEFDPAADDLVVDIDAAISAAIDTEEQDNRATNSSITDDLFNDEDWKSEKVKKRDTLSQIFNRFGLSSKEAYTLVTLEEAAPLKLIRPGEKIEVVTTASEGDQKKQDLAALRYQLDKFKSLVVLRTDEGYQIETEIREPVVQHKLAQATIEHSLLGAAKAADIPYDIVYQLASIFGWQVDFARDIKSGDQLKLIYEELYLDEELVGHGEIIAAELFTALKQYRAIRHTDEQGHVTYFAPNGDGIQGSFLRSPLKFARVTSKFSKKRFHPVLKKWRAHKGVDYGAPMKTPIMATGDGIVTLAGRKKGYGKTVIIRHGHKYQTLYAHMNSYAKGIKAGARVKQGEVIGYVGKTGWTTGPHLHYEFRINGVHQNPLTVELPKSAPIDKKYEIAFKKNATVWVAALNRAGRIPLAQNDL